MYHCKFRWLAAQLKKRKIDYRLLDNVFLDIADWEQVQRIADGWQAKWAPMQKTIYSLPALRELLVAANRRYLEFLSTIDDPGAGIDQLNRVSRTVHHNDRSYPGFNFFDDDDQMLFEALARGEFNISGLQHKTLRPNLSGKSSGQIFRLLKRLRLHGLIKTVGRTYKDYLTAFRKQVITAGLKLKELFLVPQLAFAPTRIVGIPERRIKHNPQPPAYQ